MRYPFDKKFILSSEQAYLTSYQTETVICLPPHLGSFGKVRKNHIHEGIDIYCEAGDKVYAMDDGVILNILPFTGEQVGSPWWHNTYCILVKHKECVLNYGELVPLPYLTQGETIKKGNLLGYIIPVLKQNKGLPMNMLHLEKYTLDTIMPIKEWALNTSKPTQLQDPTELLLTIYNQSDTTHP